MTANENPTQRECRNPVTRPRLLLGLVMLSIGPLFWLAESELVYGLLDPPPVGLPGGIPPYAYAAFKAGLLVLLAVLGIACVTAGVFCLAYRSGILFDRTANTVTIWWKWLGPKRSTRYDLRSFAGVLLADKPEDPVTFFPSYVHCSTGRSIHLVYLTGPPGPRLPVAIVKGSQQTAEAFAEQVMSFLPDAD
jgi:hypothetical protein